jgi:hypothetical protein
LAQAETLSGDVSAFCRSFDHRNAALPLSEEAKTSVERTAVFLGGDCR